MSEFLREQIANWRKSKKSRVQQLADAVEGLMDQTGIAELIAENQELAKELKRYRDWSVKIAAAMREIGQETESGLAHAYQELRGENESLQRRVLELERSRRTPSGRFVEVEK